MLIAPCPQQRPLRISTRPGSAALLPVSTTSTGLLHLSVGACVHRVRSDSGNHHVWPLLCTHHFQCVTYTHLEKVFVLMSDEQDVQIFKSHNDYVQNKRKFFQYLQYAEAWQSVSVICLYTAFLYDILLIVTFIAFLLKHRKTMQAMLAVFITTNMSGIPPSKVHLIGRMFPPLFAIYLPKEDQIIEDLEDIEGMQTTIQVI